MRVIPGNQPVEEQPETIDVSRGCVVFSKEHWPFANSVVVKEWWTSDGESRENRFTPGEGFAWTTKGRLVALSKIAVEKYFPEVSS